MQSMHEAIVQTEKEIRELESRIQLLNELLESLKQESSRYKLLCT
jgi:prefoldin subunit 5